MNTHRRRAALTMGLMLSLSAHAVVLVPTRVRNDTPVTVRITVNRVVSCATSDRPKDESWVIKVILSPGQEDTLLLMGGAHDLCKSAVQSLTIETATGKDSDQQGRPILPLLMTDHFPEYWSVLHVQVDPRNHHLTLRAVDSVR